MIPGLAVLLAMLLVTPAHAGDLAPASPPPPEAQVLPGFLPPEDRVFAQFVWDARTGTLDRRTYVFGDPLASEGLDLFWQADDPGADAPGRLSGSGSLLWQEMGEGGGVIASYRGTLRNGLFHGEGSFAHRSGARYEGGWQDGRMHGSGRLHLPSGDEYEGGFSEGRRSGTGVYIDRFGTVYRGGFAAGHRDGEGTVYPVSAAAFRARWRDGAEEPGSRAAIPGQRGLSHIHPSEFQTWPDAGVPVSVLMVNGDPRIPASPVQYVAGSDGETLVVYPGDQKLLDGWYGTGNIAAHAGRQRSYVGLPERYEPVGLQFGLENRSTVPMRVVGAFLDVTANRSERRPVLTVNGNGAAESCNSPGTVQICRRGTVDTVLYISNHGWGLAENLVLRAGFTTADGVPLTAESEVALGLVGKRSAVDLTTILSGNGVNIPFLEQHRFPCSDAPTCLGLAQASGAFGSLTPGLSFVGYQFKLNLRGTLSFEWSEQDGRRLTGTARFETEVQVGEATATAEEGEGGEPEPLRATPYVLQVDQPAYRQPLPLSADVPAGQMANWTLSLEAPMTSTTEFRFVLQLADGREVASRPVRLLYFRLNDWPEG